MDKFKINVSSHSFELDSKDTSSIDIVEKEDKSLHVLASGHGYSVVPQGAHEGHKKQTIVVNGNSYEVEIADPLDQLLSTMGMTLNASQQLKEIKAPMPGLILDILVEEGQSITKGDPILILEAMKMENVLKAEGDGVIGSIEAKKTDSVEKGQLLIKMQ